MEDTFFECWGFLSIFEEIKVNNTWFNDNFVDNTSFNDNFINNTPPVPRRASGCAPVIMGLNSSKPKWIAASTKRWTTF